MLRMEIALILILAFVAVMYFSAERKKSQLHKVFSILLVVVLVHFEWLKVIQMSRLKYPDMAFVIVSGYDDFEYCREARGSESQITC